MLFRSKEALREVIREVSADVLVVQEVGPRPYLEELRRDLRAEGLNYSHIVLAAAADADRIARGGRFLSVTRCFHSRMW